MKVKEKFKNPRWRLNHLYKIVDKTGFKSQFKENKFQKHINDNDAPKKMILKPRQVGISTNELIKQLDYTIWNKNINACILAHKRESLKPLFKIIRTAYDSMDERIKPVLDKGGGSMYELRFPEVGSRIFCTLEAISQTIHWLHISEAAFIKEQQKIKDTMEAVPFGAPITFESTANGMANYFYERWMEGDDKKFFFPWFMFDEYKITQHEIKRFSSAERKLKKKAKKYFGVDLTKDQIAWRRWKKKDQKDLFLQYYPEDDQSCFLTSGTQPVDLMIVKELFDNAPEPIDKSDEWLKIWEPYNSAREYVIGADTSEGVEGDFSVACVMDIKTRKKVAQIRSNRWKPSEFAEKIVYLADKYTKNDGIEPYLGVERNNHGHAVLQWLDEVHLYSNLYYTDKEHKRVGWTTDRVTRPLMIDTFIEGLENGTINIPDKETLGECLTLVNNDGKIEAAEGKHDDCVIATSIALQLALEIAPLEAVRSVGDFKSAMRI